MGSASRRPLLTEAIIETYRVSKTIKAPLKFTYAWCTDFREDDPKMIGSKNRRHILEHTRKRVIWVVAGKKGKPDAVRVVWLHPPDSWHLETCGDETEVGEYRLTPLGKEKTKLEMTFRATYYDRKDVESRESYEAEAMSHWDSYAKYLERDYERSLRR